MCCETCSRYTSCEEEGHLNDLCCVSCADHHSCYGKNGARNRENEEPEGEFEDI